MRYLIVVLWMLFWSVPSAMAQVSIGIGLPGVNIGINFPLFPELVQVPDYPVYYAPRLNSNYFFYDGMYWVYQDDNWYASSWYNGPWGMVGPEVVPLYVLRIPVRYYRNPPMYFRGWQANSPPRWGEHWGNQWEQHRSGWDKWNRSSAPAAAPLPAYQRQYSGDRYPRAEQQQALRNQNYRYQPRDPVVRQHYQEQAVQKAPAPAERERQGASQDRSPRQQDAPRSNAPAPQQQGGPAVPRAQPPQRGGEDVQKSAPAQATPQQRGAAVQEQRQQPQPQAQPQPRPQPQAQPQPQPQPRAQPQPQAQPQPRAQPQQGEAQREQPTPRSGQENVPQGKGATQERGRGQAQEKEREKADERGQERNK